MVVGVRSSQVESGGNKDKAVVSGGRLAVVREEAAVRERMCGDGSSRNGVAGRWGEPVLGN